MNYRIMLSTLAIATACAIPLAHAADGDQKYTKEEFKSDAKAAGKGMKDAAVGAGHQVKEGTKKAYRADKAKVKKDVKDRRPGDGTIAKKNDSQPVATPGHN